VAGRCCGAAIIIAILVVVGCSPGSPHDAAVEAWNRHLRLVTKDLVSDRGLVDGSGSPAASSGCRRGGRIDDYTLYACTVVFQDGTQWAGVARVNDDGTAFIRTALHPLDAPHELIRP